MTMGNIYFVIMVIVAQMSEQIIFASSLLKHTVQMSLLCVYHLHHL